MNELAGRLGKVSREYPAPSGSDDIAVLRDVNLSVRSGESVAIVGPSGSGKSTLLNILGCLDRPTSGTVMLNDSKVDSLSESERAALRNRYLGFVFQLHHLLPQCTVLENIRVPTLPDRRFKATDGDRSYKLAEKVGLADRLDHRPAELSGGECLRAAIARALVNRPVILLADEPTGSLDSKTSDKIGDLLFEINRTEGTALVLVTHSAALASRADTVYTLDNGVLVE